MSGRVAILGLGPRGAGWAARFALMGWAVRWVDADDGAIVRLDGVLTRARAALPGLYDAPLPEAGALTRCATVAEACEGADWIVEALRPGDATRGDVLAQARAAAPEAMIASAGGVALGDVQALLGSAHRLVVAEAAHPGWLIPAVELAAPDGLIDEARGVLAGIGMQVIRSAGAAARLRAALAGARAELADEGLGGQAVDAVLAGVVGPALMGGEEDALLVALLRAVRSAYRAGTGPLRGFEAAQAAPDLETIPIITLAMAVPASWADYNGHMTEAEYLTAFGFATDRFMQLVGMDAAYVAAGRSLFTVETHIRHLDEALVGTAFQIRTRVLEGAGKRLSLWHEMWAGERLCATAENMMLHVDLGTRRTSVPPDDLAERLARLAAADAALPRPEGAGRVGQKG